MAENGHLSNQDYCVDRQILMSIRPEWTSKILSGEKIVEVRKTMPRMGDYRVYIYETKNGGGRGKVVGEFNTFISPISRFNITRPFVAEFVSTDSCLSVEELLKYAGAKETVCLWHIGNLRVFEHPQPLEFFAVARPPQSWAYLYNLMTSKHRRSE